MTEQQIIARLPYQEPFLFVDEITHVSNAKKEHTSIKVILKTTQSLQVLFSQNAWHK